MSGLTPGSVGGTRAPGNAGLVARRLVIRETAVAVLVNALIAIVIVWLLFRGSASIPVLGPQGGAFGVLPGTFMFTFLLTIGLTLALRRRVRAGTIVRSEGEVTGGLARRLPGPLLARALVLALAAEVLLVPATFAVLAAFAPASWSYRTVLVFNVAYFAVLSLLVVPLVVRRALLDSP